MLNNYEKLADIGKGKSRSACQFGLFAPFFTRFYIQIFGVFLIGSFGRVSKVRRVSDGRILVWKELDYGKMNDKEKQ